jgi:uncharacterized membrane protein YgdD (TMEM256/DUF423 family)
MQRTFFRLASLFAMLAVVLGAFGAHALKAYLSEQSMAGFQTATTYMMTHAIAIFIVGILHRHYKKKTMVWAGNLFITGIILFSGSIYLRQLLLFLGFEKTAIVALVTPLGGLMFILGWLFVFLSISPKENAEKHPKDDD